MSGVEWSGVQCNAVEWVEMKGVEWIGVGHGRDERSGVE